MNDNDGLSAVQDCLTAAKGALAETHMQTPLDAIVRRGRAARRRRRLMGLTGTGAVAAGVALAVGLTGATGSGPTHSAGAARTDAFTLVRHANGTVTLTFIYRVRVDPGLLQRALARDGIPAMVTPGWVCGTAYGTESQLIQLIPTFPRSHRVTEPGFWLDMWVVVPRGANRGQAQEIHSFSLAFTVIGNALTIDPSAMPPGKELSFGDFADARLRQAAPPYRLLRWTNITVGLIDVPAVSRPYHCGFLPNTPWYKTPPWGNPGTSPSATRAASPSATPAASPSATPTSSPSATPTFSPSATPTSSPSATVSP